MIHASKHCGLTLLSRILQEIYPHLGGKFIDIIDEISKLQVDQGDTLVAFLERTLTLKRRIIQSKHSTPGTAIFSRFLKQLMKTEKLNTVLAAIHSEFTNHVIMHGPDTPFHRTEYKIYKLIVSLGFSRDTMLTSQSSCNNRFQANFTNYNSSDEQDFLDFEPTTCAGKYDPCEICGQLWHPTHKCWCRGGEWKPVWIKQNAEKYNAAHPNDKPDQEYINAP